MKRTIIIICFIFVGMLIYLTFNELSFNPLKESDLKKLFRNYNGGFEKVCSLDLVKFSMHGELFELYKFNIKNVEIESEYPKISFWEGKEITNETIISKWKRCPLDSLAIKRFDFLFSTLVLNENSCCQSLGNTLLDSNNHYCYVYIDGLEEYFLVYSKNNEVLYYIRKRGV